MFIGDLKMGGGGKGGGQANPLKPLWIRLCTQAHSQAEVR